MPHPDAEIQKAIDEAREIVRQDKILASHKELHAKWDKVHPPEPTPDPDQPPAPDPKDPPADPPKGRKGLWWPTDDSNS